MAELRMNRKELADLIRDGIFLSHCPRCATELYLRLSDVGGGTAKVEAMAKSATPLRREPEAEQPKCVSCSRPITAYAFAVRRGLCPDCFAVMGARLDKPGQPREPPPPEAPAPGPGSGP